MYQIMKHISGRHIWPFPINYNVTQCEKSYLKIFPADTLSHGTAETARTRVNFHACLYLYIFMQTQHRTGLYIFAPSRADRSSYAKLKFIPDHIFRESNLSVCLCFQYIECANEIKEYIRFVTRITNMNVQNSIVLYAETKICLRLNMLPLQSNFKQVIIRWACIIYSDALCGKGRSRYFNAK